MHGHSATPMIVKARLGYLGLIWAWSGHPHAKPMKTLKSYRMIEPALGSPIFANQYGIDICGTVKVGDEIFAEM